MQTALVCTLAVLLYLAGLQSPASAQGLGYSSCNNPLVLIDRYNGMSPGYAPPDLTYLANYGVPTTGGGQLLRQEAAAALSNMVTDANASGVELVSSSAWRSYYTQASLYSYWSSVYGPGAGGVSAPPGHSMHQLGTTVDLTNAATGYGLYQSFASTNSYSWLLNNARYYGFVLTYPPGANTGYIWEPWQWRYVGVQNALNIAGSGLGLQGYLSNNGVLPNC
ncbi:MAG: D-alanyl-D-alanine carboxypeptidase family protein [Rubrobacteraceae bacterium]